MESLLPKKYGADAAEIAGARHLLDALTARNVSWAIVTSGTSPLVKGWLEVLQLPTPEHLVVAEDVENGKPDPACYLLGLAKLGLQGEAAGAQVLVVEDSPAGIRAGKAAGCKVLGLVTSHSAEQVVAAGPDWVVRDLRSVKVVEGVELEISDVLEMK
jgi:glycerol 3-phosphatase-1